MLGKDRPSLWRQIRGIELVWTQGCATEQWSTAIRHNILNAMSRNPSRSWLGHGHWNKTHSIIHSVVFCPWNTPRMQLLPTIWKISWLNEPINMRVQVLFEQIWEWAPGNLNRSLGWPYSWKKGKGGVINPSAMRCEKWTTPHKLAWSFSWLLLATGLEERLLSRR